MTVLSPCVVVAVVRVFETCQAQERECLFLFG
jgi:hypothetical protein